MISLIKTNFSSLWELATPSSITYLWGFGSFLGILMSIQIGSGLVLTFYYVSGAEAWNSVIEVMREVMLGWLVRLVHSNVASFVFVVIFLHFLRGLYYSSFYLTGPWLSGWSLLALSMMAAFLGYVLPWGQMSFWGATVIINLLSVLPMGKLLVIWLWSGFYVSHFTCTFFFSMHYLIPMVILVLVAVHLALLHFSGSTTPVGSMGPELKIKFQELFLAKDMINLTLLFSMWLILLTYPDWSADPVNFTVSDLSTSPLHIQPEWYFLHLYAILRSIPNKLGGLVGFAMALLALTFLALSLSIQNSRNTSCVKHVFWAFLFSNLILLWLGGQPVEAPYIFMGQTMTISYFVLIFTWIFTDSILSEMF